MSSTNRGSNRIFNDQYFTPAWVTHRLLERVKLPSGRWLEPCAGNGAIIKAANEIRFDIDWYAIEIDPTHRDSLVKLVGENNKLIGDAIKCVPSFGRIIVNITNPPFSIAQEILEACLKTGALVVFLQRLNWCAGPRAELFRKLKPSVYVIPDRISFTDGGSDSIEYGWFVFDGKGQFEILDNTPLEIRRPEKEKVG